MTCELLPENTGRDGERDGAKCVSCPRDGEPRLQAVPNYGVNGGQLASPNPWLLETVMLCDGCALLREDVL